MNYYSKQTQTNPIFKNSGFLKSKLFRSVFQYVLCHFGRLSTSNFRDDVRKHTSAKTLQLSISGSRISPPILYSKRLTSRGKSPIIQNNRYFTQVYRYLIIVITKEEILKSLAKDKPELQRQFKVSRLALFGSYARGEQRPDSDVDILVEVDPSIGLEFVTLAERFEKLLGTSVDLVSIRAVTAKAMKFIEPELIYV